MDADIRLQNLSPLTMQIRMQLSNIRLKILNSYSFVDLDSNFCGFKYSLGVTINSDSDLDSKNQIFCE